MVAHQEQAGTPWGGETQFTARGHVDAEVASQRSAQSLFEYGQGQLKGAVKYKQGLEIQ